MNIFISYASQDSEWAKELGKSLAAQGSDPWLNECKTQPNESWEEEIRQALVQSDAFVAVLGAQQPSPNVLFDTGMALSLGKCIIPVVLGDNTDVSVFNDITTASAIHTIEADSAAAHILSNDPETSGQNPETESSSLQVHQKKSSASTLSPSKVLSRQIL